ncbi:DUF4176 domain-containing protein [Macrococcoides canis]|uniref:DUF4176 domain-containing protein n=1 Tax=Macrococcoides canis TaxID=1855823 RepID=UPI0039C9CF37
MLPIGSFVYLKEGTQMLMILNRGPIIETDGKKLLYDYSACLYPIDFNKENIDR